MPNFADPTVIPDRSRPEPAPAAAAFDVLLCLGGRSTDPFHDIADIAAMEAQFSEPDYLAGVPICTKDGE